MNYIQNEDFHAALLLRKTLTKAVLCIQATISLYPPIPFP